VQITGRSRIRAWGWGVSELELQVMGNRGGGMRRSKAFIWWRQGEPLPPQAGKGIGNRGTAFPSGWQAGHKSVGASSSGRCNICESGVGPGAGIFSLPSMSTAAQALV